MKYIWKKPYQGPFTKAEAIKLVGNIKSHATPAEHDIYDAAIRKRRNQDTFDVLIKTTK